MYIYLVICILATKTTFDTHTQPYVITSFEK